MREVVKAVICKDHKYLLQLRDNDITIDYPNTWSFFGGEVDEGENFEEALKRELEEELSWHSDELFFIDKITNKEVECNIYFYMVNCEAPEDSLVLGEGQAMEWFSIEEVMDLTNTAAEIKNIIRQAAYRFKKA
ncbi:MAG: NUDIX domain-containing protein [Desulfobacterales bacterium]|jgi:8-oxo-dGTP pyrophosphatase MutT (NUDIX family)|nr:NUDIX domain-containing protein [Desulfobacterales bacterium]|tara:strand:- start:40116 stop:40517 length:402 start_codon:yes stop_codon:yes gene_type:complete